MVDESNPWDNWSEPAKAEMLAMLRSAQRSRIWYCGRGRECDGKPHKGVAYKHARGSQWPPAGEWLVWLMSSGRGTGKTRSAAEWTRKMADHAGRIALVAPTGPDLRETMIEGESGLIYVCERAGQPGKWEPSRRRFTFANGAIASGYSAEEPDRLRGPQHAAAWCDEPAHWEKVAETWDNLMFGLRLGRRPQVAATTTPLPSDWIRRLIADEYTVVTRESTYANLDNLAPTFARTVLSKYEGTRLGRQELHGEILTDVEGALWATDMIDDYRVQVAPEFDRIVVGVDPAGTSAARSDETGILVVGRGVDDGHLYVLADYSGRYTPAGWAERVASAYDTWNANVVVAEKNYGGEMVRSTLRNAEVFMKVVDVTSRQGKAIRAEPVNALYEQGRVHHVGEHETLERQLTEWVPGKGKSPDRLDALVHAAHDLVQVTPGSQFAVPSGTFGSPAARVPRSRAAEVAATLAPVVQLYDPARKGA